VTLEDCLQRFAALGEHEIPWVWTHDGGAGPHAVFGGIVHGVEVGPVPGLLAIAEALRDGTLTFAGRASFFLGNVEAAKRGQRLVEADLNRVFVPEGESLEHRRARQLMPLLDAADVFVDFHQTSRPAAQPFWIGPWTQPIHDLIAPLGGAEVWTTRAPGQSFQAGTCCGDEYARAQGATAITLELGLNGFTELAAARAEHVVRGVLAGFHGERPAPLPLELFVDAGTIPFDDPMLALREGFENFEPVQAGQELAAPGATSLPCPADGALLFPKYPERDASGAALDPRPITLAHIVRPLGEDPAVLWG